MKLFHCAVVAFAVALPISVANAAPIVDGTFDAANYSLVVNDNQAADLAEDFYGTGLDMLRIGFDKTADTVYIGFETVAPLIVTGDPTASGRHRVTGFLLDIATGSPDNLYYSIEIYTTGSSNIRYADLWVSSTGAADSFVYVADALAATIGTSSIEFSFHAADLVLPGAFDFIAQLDGSGEWDDDQIDGGTHIVPEPATLALFAAGSVLIATGRKRRHA